MFLNQGTRQPEASQQEVNGDMASEWEELVELDDVQLATVVGGARSVSWDVRVRLSDHEYYELRGLYLTLLDSGVNVNLH